MAKQRVDRLTATETKTLPTAAHVCKNGQHLHAVIRSANIYP